MCLRLRGCAGYCASFLGAHAQVGVDIYTCTNSEEILSHIFVLFSKLFIVLTEAINITYALKEDTIKIVSKLEPF